MCLRGMLFGVLFVLAVGSLAPPAHAVSGQITICASADWKITSLTWDSAIYQCQSICPVQNGQQCTYETQDILGNKLRALAFVADSMGGEMRWNTPSQLKGAVLQHDGGTGTNYKSDKHGSSVRAQWVQFESSGFRLIETKWQTGALGMGWFSRMNGKPTSLPVLTARPAAAIKWARTYLVPTTVKFGTVGCSGGSIATFAPVYWHGLDGIIDYQYLTGALPAAWDIPATCSLTRSFIGETTLLALARPRAGAREATSAPLPSPPDRTGALPPILWLKA